MKGPTVSDTPALDHLLGAYFHEDWNLDGTAEQVISSFIRDEPDLGAALPLEIDLLLATTPDESDVERVLERKGCYYWPDPTRGYRGWLAEVAGHARRASVPDH